MTSISPPVLHPPLGLSNRLLEELQRNNLSLPEQAEDTQPVPASSFVKLYRQAIEQLDAQIAHGQGHPPMRKQEVDLMCRCLMSCSTLRTAILCAADFCAMLLPRAGRLSLQVTGSSATFHMDSLRPKRSSAACIIDLTGLFCYLQLFSWLIGESLAPQQAFIAHPERSDAVPFLSLFNAPVIVGQPTYGFSFSAELLERPVIRQPAELAAFLVDFPFRLVVRPTTVVSVTQQVRFFLEAAAAHGREWPSLDAIAGTLHLSSATLRRRLKAEGSSYQDLRRQCLFASALHYLRATDWSISRIAEQLGFSNETAFRRAFMGWTGSPPSHYRLEHLLPTGMRNKPDTPEVQA
ncbi:MAG: AraC family transcriptional regulator ligand-binding domain-containing protein [Pseudomonas sp.]